MAPRYPTPVRLTTGTVLAERYRLTALLGQGGMGEVWAARHVLTGKAVAVKRLMCTTDERGQREARARFALEAKSACAVEHPNVVEVFDFIEDDERPPFIVMELLRGETLAARLARGPLGSAREAAALLLPVVSAVGTAHQRGIVHRDLKPSNIFIDVRPGDAGRALVKVLDFGIAKWLTGNRDDGALRTRTGSTLGTPSYMAPEQATGDRAADHRVDIWSLGVILYEALSGVRPLEGDNAAQLVMRLLSTGIMPIEHLVPELPAQLAELIGRMLSRDVTRRPADLREVYGVLSALSGEVSLAFGAPPVPEHAALPGRLLTVDAGGPVQPPLGVLETHTAIELNTTPLLGDRAASRPERRVSRPVLLALVGCASLLASVAVWVGRRDRPGVADGEPGAQRDARAALAPGNDATSSTSAASAVDAPGLEHPSNAPARGAAPAPVAREEQDAPRSGLTTRREPARASAPLAAIATSPPSGARPGLLGRHSAPGPKRSRPATTRSPTLASSAPSNATPSKGRMPEGASAPRPPEAAARAGAAAAAAKARGAECESSAECESRLCVAYTCQ